MKKYELSYGQKSLFFLQKFDPSSTAYNVGIAFKSYDKVDMTRLYTAMDKLLNRHEILRTGFVNEDGKVYQYIDEKSRYDCFVTDISGMEEDEIRQKVNHDFHRPFDLLNDNLFRIYLYKNESYDLISMVIHHIIVDFYSVEIILNDFISIYQGQEDAMTARDEQAVSYDIFVDEEKEFVSSPKFQEKIEFWKKNLADLDEGLEYEALSGKTGESKIKGAKELFYLSEEKTEKIRKICEKKHISPFIFFLTVYKLFLFQVYGKRDVVVGVPVNLRRAAKYKSVVGDFVNVLPIRMRTAGGSFEQNAKEVNKIFVDAMLNKKVPYSLIVESVSPGKGSSNPLFRTAFNFLEERIKDNGLNMNQSSKDVSEFLGYRYHGYDVDQQLDQEDMSLEIVQDAGGYTGAFKYSRDFFTKEKIEEFAERYQKLIARIIDSEDIDVEELKYFDEKEKHDLIYISGRNSKEFKKYDNVVQMIEEKMDIYPDRCAVRDERTLLTYRELREKVAVLSSYLRKKGVKKGSPVIAYMNKNVDVIVAFLSIMKAGGIYIPIDVSFPRNRIEYILECTDSSYMISNRELIEKEEFLKDAFCVEDILESGSEADADEEVERITASDSAYIIFTSGSTGKPKGVEIGHGALVNFLQSMEEVLELKGKENVNIGGVTSIAFDISILEFLLPLTLGGQSSLLTKKLVTDADKFDRCVREMGINVFQATATTWTMLLKLGWKGYKNIGVLVGGEMVSKELAHSLTSAFDNVWNVYGPTEATIWATAKKLSVTDEVVTIGPPLHNYEAYILDDDHEIVQKNVVGKLFLAGEGLAKGYYKREELTRERFINASIDGTEKRIYDTGDLARYLSNGEIEVIGRADDQVKLSGYRIELGEIQSVIDKFEGIKNNAVVIKDRKLTAYIVYEGDEDNLLKRLREFCKKELTPYMIPSEFIIVPSIPLTPNQKTDKKTLMSMKGRKLSENKITANEGNGAYDSMILVWKDVIGDFEFGLDDNFFDVGGTSLLAMALQEKINSSLGEKVELPDIFAYTTVRSMGDFIMSRKKVSEESSAPLTEKKRTRNRLGDMRKQRAAAGRTRV